MAGVKTEEDFYKKFPTQEAFMSKHKKQFDKMAMGGSVRKKYAVGTKVNSYVENPSQALSQNAHDMDLSMIEGMTNPLANGLDIVGNIAASAGIQGMKSAVGGMKDGLGKDVASGVASILPMLFAMGGSVPANVPVEIEGKEVGELPNGEVFEAVGPSHENDGIDVALPEGTEMYSKRVKVDGVSMADRKKKRKKKQVSLEELLSKNPTDKLLKNSLKRTQETNEIEDGQDKKIQEVVKSSLESQNQEHAYGGGVKKLPKYKFGTDIKKLGEDIDLKGFENIFGGQNNLASLNNLDFNTSMPTSENNYGLSEIEEKFFGTTPKTKNENSNSPLKFNVGDAMSMAGTAYSAFAPMQNTKNMRAGKNPNVNAFENFGSDALAALENSKDQVQIQTDNALSDVALSSASQTKKNRNSARGINQMRALDLVTNLQDKQVKSDINMNAAQILQSIFGQQAQLENQQDQVVMQGEQNRDAADRADRDNFFSQLSQDISTKGQGIQQLGKMANQIKTNKISEEAINSMSKFGFNWKNGVLYDSNNNPATEAQRQKLASSNGYDNYTDYKNAMGI